ncbi:hypothetical protein PSTT_03029, partial [Puccinia striiformis]
NTHTPLVCEQFPSKSVVLHEGKGFLLARYYWMNPCLLSRKQPLRKSPGTSNVPRTIELFLPPRHTLKLTMKEELTHMMGNLLLQLPLIFSARWRVELEDSVPLQHTVADIMTLFAANSISCVSKDLKVELSNELISRADIMRVTNMQLSLRPGETPNNTLAGTLLARQIGIMNPNCSLNE